MGFTTWIPSPVENDSVSFWNMYSHQRGWSAHTHTTLQEKQCPSHSWTPLCSGSSFTSTCGEKHVPARHNRATSARWPRWPYGKNRWKFTNGPWWTLQGTQRRYWTSPSKICSTVVPMTTRLEALRSLRSAMKEIQYRRGFPGGHTSPWAESTNGWKFFWSPNVLGSWFIYRLHFLRSDREIRFPSPNAVIDSSISDHRTYHAYVLHT